MSFFSSRPDFYQLSSPEDLCWRPCHFGKSGNRWFYHQEDSHIAFWFRHFWSCLPRSECWISITALFTMNVQLPVLSTYLGIWVSAWGVAWMISRYEVSMAVLCCTPTLVRDLPPEKPKKVLDEHHQTELATWYRLQLPLLMLKLLHDKNHHHLGYPETTLRLTGSWSRPSRHLLGYVPWTILTIL